MKTSEPKLKIFASVYLLFLLILRKENKKIMLDSKVKPSYPIYNFTNDFSLHWGGKKINEWDKKWDWNEFLYSMFYSNILFPSFRIYFSFIREKLQQNEDFIYSKKWFSCFFTGNRVFDPFSGRRSFRVCEYESRSRHVLSRLQVHHHCCNFFERVFKCEISFFLQLPMQLVYNIPIYKWK